MTGTVYTCLHTNQSRSYLNHLVYPGRVEYKVACGSETYPFRNTLYCIQIFNIFLKRGKNLAQKNCRRKHNICDVIGNKKIRKWCGKELWPDTTRINWAVLLPNVGLVTTKYKKERKKEWEEKLPLLMNDFWKMEIGEKFAWKLKMVNTRGEAI